MAPTRVGNNTLSKSNEALSELNAVKLIAAFVVSILRYINPNSINYVANCVFSMIHSLDNSHVTVMLVEFSVRLVIRKSCKTHSMTCNTHVYKTLFP